jgi:hypothetical protein
MGVICMTARVRVEKRNRRKIEFWLDYNKPEEVAVGEWLSLLRKNRKLRPALVTASKMLMDFEQGHFQTAFEFYPELFRDMPRAANAGHHRGVEDNFENRGILVEDNESGQKPSLVVQSAKIDNSEINANITNMLNSFFDD